MRLTAQDYAAALIGLTEDKTEAETAKLVTRLLALLKERRALSLLPKIVAAVTELSQKQRGEISASVTSARPLSKTLMAGLTNLVKERSGAAEVVWQETIDEDLLAGAELSFGDKVINISLQNYLTQIKKTLINN